MQVSFADSIPCRANWSGSHLLLGRSAPQTLAALLVTGTRFGLWVHRPFVSMLRTMHYF